MAEKPGPVEDEVERALASMRTGFLSGAYEIAAGVSSLEEHLAEAPHDEREALRAEVGKLVAAQERLRTRLERLPGTSWDRFKAMVSLVKAQQTILDQVGDLVKKHVLPRQVENLSAAAETAAGPTAVQAPRASAAQRAASVHHGDEEERRPLFGRAGGWARANGGLAAMVAAGIVLSLIPRETRLQDLAAKLIDMVGAKIEPAASGADTTAAT
jgi:hypothetical protein